MGRNKNKGKQKQNASVNSNPKVMNDNDSDNINVALTNKPVELSPGGQRMDTKLNSSDTVESKTELEKVIINGDKGILSTIDEEGKSLNVDPEEMKPQVIGDGLVPKVLRNENVYSMSGYWPKSSTLNDINLVLSPKVDTLLKFPKLRFKNINDIPIWIKYEVLLNRTVKMMFDYKVPLTHEDYGTFVSLQNKMIENLLKLAEQYDVIWKDFKSDTDYSILNGKRIMKNLSLQPEHMSDPMKLARSIEGSIYSYDDVMTPYFSENIPVKDDVNNVRKKNTFRIDEVSMYYLQNLTRPPSRTTTYSIEQTPRFMGLPPDFKYGYPSDYELETFFDDTMTTQHYVTSRINVLQNNPSIESRVYYNNFDFDDGRLDRVKRLIVKYDVLFDKVNMFSGLLKNSFLANVQLAASTANSLSNMFAQTEFGISALRRTAKTAVISSLSSASVPGFINAILRLYFDNNVRLTFQLNAEFAVNWTFNAMMFVFLFKPQVSSRGNAMALTKLMVNNFCKILQVPFISVPTSLAVISDYISGELVDAITDWWNYSQTNFDPESDYNALYTNYGSRVNRGTIAQGYFSVETINAGYRFWGKPALSPWRRVPTTEDDGSFANSLTLLLTVKKNQWSTIWSEFVTCVVNDMEFGFITNLSRFVYSLDLFAGSELNMNRFRNDFKDQEIEIDNRSLLSFAMYSRVSDVPYYQSNVSSFKLFFLSMDYYLSQAAMFYTCFKRIEGVLMSVAGLVNYSSTFFKEWDMLNLVGSYCEHEIVKAIFTDVNFNNINTLRMTVGRSNLNDMSLMASLTSEYSEDMSIDDNSRWFTFMKALDIITDQAEWRKFGLEDSFTIGPVEIGTSFNNLFRTKIKATTLNTYINYRQNYMKFGDYDFQKNLWKTSLSQTIGFKIPTFVKYKLVKKLNDGNAFKASTGEDTPFKWMFNKKDPVTSDDFRIDSVQIDREIVVQWERDYQYDQIFHELKTALAGDETSLFIYEESPNDFNILVRAESITDDFYIDDLNDISVEFNSAFSTEFTNNMSFEPRFKTFLAIV